MIVNHSLLCPLLPSVIRGSDYTGFTVITVVYFISVLDTTFILV
jgi:hypothetical protein